MDKNEVLDKIRSNITPGQEWMCDNLQYLTLMGSHAYGTNNENSDFDVYGFTIPPKEYVYPEYIAGFEKPDTFEQFEGKVVGKTKKECLDFSIYNITKYFYLVSRGNPNMLDSLFTGPNCVLMATEIGQKVRENRKTFLHKGAWPCFKGYAWAQFDKIRVKPEDRENPERKASIEKYGYDCYVDKTDFLTLNGWKKYDTIDNTDKLATLNPKTFMIEYQDFVERFCAEFTGNLFNLCGYGTNVSVTPNHNIFYRPVYRGRGNLVGSWGMVPVSLLPKTFDIVETIIPDRYGSCKMEFCREWGIPPEVFLNILGCFLSEGTFSMRQKQEGFTLKSIRISQLCKHSLYKYNFKRLHKRWGNRLNSSLFAYKRKIDGRELVEGVFDIRNKAIVSFLYSEVGHSKNKRIPRWVFSLSRRWKMLLLSYMLRGDGTCKKEGEIYIYYTSSKQLADDVQELAFLCGYKTTLWGPYESVGVYGKCSMFHVFIKKVTCQHKRCEYNDTIKIKPVDKARIVCFTVPNSILITRLDGRIGIQGNSKYATHIFRLLDEVEQILTLGDMSLIRNREQLKRVREGYYKLEEIDKYFKEKELVLEKAYSESTLPWGPRKEEIRGLLVECLDMFYKKEEPICKWYPSEGCVCECGSDISGGVCSVEDETKCPHTKEKGKRNETHS